MLTISILGSSALTKGHATVPLALAVASLATMASLVRELFVPTTAMTVEHAGPRSI